MNLKKSDKIIAIVGVVILIVAAIAIVFYMGEEKPIEEPENGEEPLTRFVVETTVYERAIRAEESHQVKDKLLGSSPTVLEEEIPVTDLKEAKIVVDFNDKQSGKLLKRLRDDTLTVSVTDEEGNKLDTKSVVGSGNATITIDGDEPINFGAIYAEDLSEANKRMEENLTDEEEFEIYTIQVSISYKGLFERLRKDSFTIKVTGEYYSYMVKELEDSEPPEEDDNKELSQQVSDHSSDTYWRYLSNTGFL